MSNSSRATEDIPRVEASVSGKRLYALAFGAIGVVFGDIGTSPLYAMETAFSIDHNAVAPTRDDVFGIISLVFWSITIIVSAKYLSLVMRANNDGEGGILALVHLLRDRLERGKLTRIALLLGILGAALFYGDSLITPAISVMSAIEGIETVQPGAESLVVPVSIAILTALFAIQRWGTGRVGKAFGPVMAAWFLILALLGLPWIARYPAIIGALSPHHALAFFIDRPFVAFIALGAAVLTITGAEAVYADMGHFGARPIKFAWFCVVMPALTLNYLGQGALIITHPDAAKDPFFAMAPDWARVPLVIVATMATVIASQAVISGAFSVSRQANRLGILPRLKVIHTSKEESGQIYVPAINSILFVGVLTLILIFQSSTRLANAYGLAVTGTEILTSSLFLLLAAKVWHIARWKIAAYLCAVSILEVLYFAANCTKIISGGWLPILIASVLVSLMLTWRWGHLQISGRRAEIEGPLDQILTKGTANRIHRVPGLGVYPHVGKGTAPLAMKDMIQVTRALHEHVIIISMVDESVPHVRHCERIEIVPMSTPCEGIVRVRCHIGFNDSRDVPKAVALALPQLPGFAGLTERQARYFLPAFQVYVADEGRHKLIRMLFAWMHQNSVDGSIALHLPVRRTFVMGGAIFL